MLYRLNKEGMTIFVSTPYMDEAELCSRVAFMDHGRIVACDSPQGLKRSYPYQLLELQAADRQVKQALAGCAIEEVNAFGDKYHLVVADAQAAIPLVRSALTAAQISVLALRQIPPTLEDVFVSLASETR
jgi:ABC-2 type transport system ATP-binding protein